MYRLALLLALLAGGAAAAELPREQIVLRKPLPKRW